jgi:hypothetical protein
VSYIRCELEFSSTCNKTSNTEQRTPSGNSFAEPYIILKASLAADAGYFGEKLTSGRQEIVGAWKARTVRLQPEFKQTDILGAVMLAGELFAEHAHSQRRTLVIYSDMEQVTKDMNLERQKHGNGRMLTDIEFRPFMVDLRDVEVFCLGVQAPNQQPSRWKEIRQFWQTYFEKANARLKNYSTFRDRPSLASDSLQQEP